MHKEIQTTIVQYDDKEIPVNVCIGLSAYPTICRDTNILVNRADKSMYYGKKHGRGRLVVDNPAVDDMQSWDSQIKIKIVREKRHLFTDFWLYTNLDLFIM